MEKLGGVDVAGVLLCPNGISPILDIGWLAGTQTGRAPMQKLGQTPNGLVFTQNSTLVTVGSIPFVALSLISMFSLPHGHGGGQSG